MIPIHVSLFGATGCQATPCRNGSYSGWPPQAATRTNEPCKCKLKLRPPCWTSWLPFVPDGCFFQLLADGHRPLHVFRLPRSNLPNISAGPFNYYLFRSVEACKKTSAYLERHPLVIIKHIILSKGPHILLQHHGRTKYLAVGANIRCAPKGRQCHGLLHSPRRQKVPRATRTSCPSTHCSSRPCLCL